MNTFKEYIDDAFLAITALGTFYFYILLLIFTLILSKKELAFHIALGLAICYLFVFFLRLFYFKERPKKESYSNLLTKIHASSFPSLHTMSSMYVAVVLANNIKNQIATIFLIIISLLIGYSRIHLKKHYLIDVLIGLILGTVLGVIYLFVLG